LEPLSFCPNSSGESESRLPDSKIPIAGESMPGYLCRTGQVREASMSLIDRYLPVYQFAERHSILVSGPAGAILDAIVSYDLASADRWTHRFMALRELPGRWLARLGFAGVSKATAFGLKDFTFLGRDGDSEIAVGLAGRFWRLDYGLVPLPDAAAFAAFARPRTAKLVVGFLTRAEGETTRFVTETRVHCPDRISLALFAPYWLLIRLASGFMRRRMLEKVKRTVEGRATS
jgi:hypothetical protein